MNARPLASIVFSALFLLLPGVAIATDPPDGEPIADALKNFEETGETRNCLFYSRIESFSPLSTSDFLFVERGVYYINTTLSPCGRALAPGLGVMFKRNGPRVCKNGLIIFVQGGSRPVDQCTLGEFREIAPKGGAICKPVKAYAASYFEAHSLLVCIHRYNVVGKIGQKRS